ncbi:aspartate--tRNA(Asn) ligase [Candidatus Amesbacteria bacterium RIFCSPHIGHO2_02_FULL_47_9]|uniref:Aspartate--tRNA(Asn) ligase n=1 Tax=Candidatus Amesbacteria bacterium RIFCSPHIGHO2_01_FULL_48_32b TaxID=1797253 RepID=A0A1F4YG50_9BACT|nr:MAG: aspartate--tRNA(Asn) ligase [Candidatus Amesbacteria bacterium RIFCSPHIGHO2_01_FULL_48_32b]OGD03024.1 MAG: aspartate--tRNA(Asn) ligase [Candidatus Amesbacteria bacterium RIFCSPHIGHO2_02_FULL_47_9]
MTRTLITDTVSRVGETVLVKGWVNTRRDHGQIVFIDLRDRTGLLQIVTRPELAEGLHAEDVIYVVGTVAKRPEKLINPKLPTGTVEVQAEKVELISKSAELPFDMGSPTLNLELPTLLDHRSLTLRHPKVQTIFQVQASLVENFRQAAKGIGCIETFPPTISTSATEGGADVLPVDYFGHSAFLVQSPQLYKQMLVGVFERVFIITHVYRAEPSVTTRHLVESIQMDCEIGFIDSFSELLDAMETVFSQTIENTQNQFEVQPSLVTNKIPRLTMREAQKIIQDRTGVDHTKEPDLMPEDEREICAWAKETHQSDLVTITHFPTRKRAFYSLPDPDNPEYSLSYDLLYKGLEISSGAQRIHDLDQLKQTIIDRGMDPAGFAMYLQAFEYGMPPHGGFSFGLERSTMKLLDLGNIREASLFPRDTERVDFRLS